LDISVIIPTFQEETYIKETLASLAKAKAYAAKRGIKSEILVVDSGNDGTLKMARPIADKVFRFTERGVSKARNFGASKASGEILIFMDADVIVSSDLFEEVMKEFSYRSTVAAISRVRPRFGFSSLPFSKRMFYFVDDLLIKNCVKYKPLLIFYNRGDVLAINRKCHLKTGGFDEKLAIMEITEVVLKLSKIGRIALLDTTVFESVRRLNRWGVLKSYLLWWKYYTLYWVLPSALKGNYEAVR